MIGHVDILSHIVDDLGALSGLISGQFDLETRRIDLGEVALSVVTSFAPDIENDNIVLEHALQPVSVIADPTRIRQALNALLQNARRYAATGRYIRVETRMENQYACLRVTDRGPGIKPSDRQRAFDRWWRAETSRSRAKGGSGLGLAIVKAIAQAHNGNVKITDGPNAQGITVTIILPDI